VNTVGIGLVEVSSIDPHATVSNNTKAHVDGTVTGRSLAIEAAATRNADAESDVVFITIIGSSGADATAVVGGDTDAFFASSARIATAGNISANARSTNQAVANSRRRRRRRHRLRRARVERHHRRGDAGLPGQRGRGSVQAGNFELQSVAINNAKADTTAGTGGVISVRGAQATATINPLVEAFIANDVSLTNVAGSLTIRADSFRAEGDAAASSYGGGVVDVGAANADVHSSPVVNAYIGTGAVIAVGGSVVVEALGRSEATGVLGDTFTPNQATIDSDRIAFTAHGLASGDLVTYNPNGNPAIGMAGGGSLQTLREYSVLINGPDALQLGAEFSAQGARHRRSLLPGSGRGR
jgi:hypothetical protein